MIFWASSVVFFILGLYPRYGYIFLFPLIAILPFSNAFSDYFYKFGLNSYDFYFFGIVVYLSVKTIFTGRIRISGLEIFILIALILMIVSLFFNEFSKYWIRDLRLILVLVFGHIIYIIFSSRLRIGSTYSLYIFFIAAISCIFWGLMSQFGKVDLTDSFYVNNAFRFFSASTYMSAAFLIFSSQFAQVHKQHILYSFVVFLSAIAVAMSGLRLLTLIVVIIFAITRIKKISAYIFIPVILIFFIFISSQYNNELLSRLVSLDTHTITSNTLIRFTPFLRVISEFSEFNFLFGSGFGTTFQIDWFEWRDSKDERNNFIDSTFLTLYEKLGILCLIYIFGFIRSLAINLPNNFPVQKILILFIIPMMIFFAVPYQTAFVGILLSLPLLRPLLGANEESHKHVRGV